MHYEINVAELRTVSSGSQGRRQEYLHLFVTAPRSCQTEEEAKRLVTLLRKALPEPQFKITVTRWETRGTPTDI